MLTTFRSLLRRRHVFLMPIAMVSFGSVSHSSIDKCPSASQMAAEQKFILDTFFGADPFPVPPEPLVPRLNKAMYAGGGSPEALAAWDKELGEKCGHFFDKLDAGDFDSWADTPEGLLATVVLCDQMSRNIFRDTARAWAYDARAQAALKKAIENPVFLDSIMKMHPAWAYNLIHVFLHAGEIDPNHFSQHCNQR